MDEENNKIEFLKKHSELTEAVLELKDKHPRFDIKKLPQVLKLLVEKGVGKNMAEVLLSHNDMVEKYISSHINDDSSPSPNKPPPLTLEESIKNQLMEGEHENEKKDDYTRLLEWIQSKVSEGNAESKEKGAKVLKDVLLYTYKLSTPDEGVEHSDEEIWSKIMAYSDEEKMELMEKNRNLINLALAYKKNFPSLKLNSFASLILFLMREKKCTTPEEVFGKYKEEVEQYIKDKLLPQ